MPDAERRRTRGLPLRARRLLEGGADLLGVGLELYLENRLLHRSRRKPRVCLTCAAASAALAAECARRRRAQSHLAEPGRDPLVWDCPRGARLAVQPVVIGGSARAILVSRRPPGRRGARGGRFPPAGVAAPLRASALDRTDRHLRLLARQLGEALRLSRRLRELRGELAAKRDELRAFYAIAGQLSASPDPSPALRDVMETARAAGDADLALLWTNGRRRHELLFRPGFDGRWGTGARRFWNALGPALDGRLAAGDHRPVSGLLTEGEPDLPCPGPPLRFLAVRLRQDGHGDGVLGLARLEPARPFQPSDALLLASLAEQIRLALSNAELYEDLQIFLMSTVKTLVSAIEEKDPYTSGHSERVHLISMLVGRELALSPAEMETLRWASILHDVGKIGLPEAILLKPGRLTAEEFARVREHPDRGYRLLRPIRQLAEAAECIRAHHEQIDGSGYPQGLRGEAIPRLARVIAVADTFDALTSTRAYRTARTLDAALAEIRRVRGAQLDRDAVDALLRLEPFLREHQVMIQASRAEERRRAA